MAMKAAVQSVGTGDLPAFVMDDDARPIVAQLRRQSVPGALLELGAIEVLPNQLEPVGAEDPVATWVREGFGIPVARFTSTTTYTDATYYAVLVALSKDALKFGGARGRNYAMARSMRGLVRGDNTIIDANVASTARPAGLLSGLSPVGSGSPSDLQDDLEQLYSAVTDGEVVRPVFVLAPRAALYLVATGLVAFKDLTLMGGRIAGAPVVIAPEAGANLILIDAGQVLISDLGLEVRVSENASIEMDDTPTQSSVTPTGSALVSAFQVNAAILKFLRYLSWQVLRDDAAAFVQLPIGGSPS